jgi:DNA topoisomerase-1
LSKDSHVKWESFLFTNNFMSGVIKEEALKLSKKAIQAAVMDVVKSAKVVDLIYVADHCEGITRVKKEDGFLYKDGNRAVKNRSVLERIKKLAIPPAWENVWICRDENGHLQATGKDIRGRKQYRYHTRWNVVRSSTKFFRLLEFGRQLPAMRAVIDKHLALPGYPKEKIMALVVTLLQKTHIRIGNGFYEKLYGSFGLTTLKNKHVTVKGTEMVFSFKGKKGVMHEISLKSKKLANLVKACKDIPGKDLFEFIDEKGQVHRIDSGMVNNYIHEISGDDFSAKDFRTWAGSREALVSFRETGGFETASQMKEHVVRMYDTVAKALGNTRTVCRKYYVHPVIVSLYESGKLLPYLDKLPEGLKSEQAGGAEEEVLLEILSKHA